MNNIIGIVNYGITGNIYSIKQAIEAAGGKVIVINNAEQLNTVDKIVLPGVGSFKDAIKELEADGLLEPLKKNTKPILGICLGMQILSKTGFEYGETEGLGFIEADVKRMQVDSVIPHMGFSKINISKNNALLKNLEKEEFYFMHSYTVHNTQNVIATSTYASFKFPSVIQEGNIFGVQFHPEKSRKAGIKLFQNFINLEII